LCFVGKGIVYS